MCAQSNPSWHDDKDIQLAVRYFHDKYAKEPKEAISEAMSHHEWMTGELRSYLQMKRICKTFEYAGSSYESTKIGNDLEFDVIVVLKAEVFETLCVKPGFFKLMCPASTNPIVKDQVGKDLPPSKLVGDFLGSLQKWLNENPNAGNIKLRLHGPAVQMDVMSGSPTKLRYSVNMVPAFQTVEGELFVAKPFHDDSGEVIDSWRLSYTPEEKNQMKTIDSDNGCRRESCRILKALRNQEATLRCLSSYVLKTALFYCSELYGDWDRRRIGKCVLRLLVFLKEAARAGRLDNKRIPGLNLLDNISSVALQNVYHRLDRLTTNKNAFVSMLKSRHDDTYIEEVFRNLSLHDDTSIDEVVRNFHDKHAKVPKGAISEAMSRHERITVNLRLYLQEKGICKTLEYAGSSYEGTKISNDLEFDVIVVLKAEVVETSCVKPGFYKLMCPASNNPIVKDKVGKDLPPSKLVGDFLGSLQKWLNENHNAGNINLGCDEAPVEIKLRLHGPAVQMDVMSIYQTKLWYSVDMVPAFQTAEGKLFVAKPFHDDSGEVIDSWRLSYTPEEKNQLKTIDSDNGCRRESYRILKALRNQEATLRCLSSYVLKTALFYCSELYEEWDRRKIGKCVLRLLVFLKEAAQAGRLDNKRIPGLNLLDNISTIALQNVYYRLDRLTTNTNAFVSVFSQ